MFVVSVIWLNVSNLPFFKNKDHRTVYFMIESIFISGILYLSGAIHFIQ